MNRVHFLNVKDGDSHFIEHESGRKTLIDISCGNLEKSADFDLLDEISKLISGDQIQKNTDNLSGNYRQKEDPTNPVLYISSFLKDQESIWRFIITHPDMDHIDGIESLFNSHRIDHVWDHQNNKPDPDFEKDKRYLKEDWKFYKSLSSLSNSKYLELFAKDNPGKMWTEDNITILCPTQKIVNEANKKGNYNDLSYVLLFTPPIVGTKENWKIIFAGDSHNISWNYIIEEYGDLVKDIDVLIAPHHGRDSDRSYEFLKTLNPRVTLLGNAKSKYLAYDKYKGLKITNNQANNIVFTCKNNIYFYVKNKAFADDYRAKKGWDPAPYNKELNAYFIYNISPKK